MCAPISCKTICEHCKTEYWNAAVTPERIKINEEHEMCYLIPRLKCGQYYGDIFRSRKELMKMLLTCSCLRE